MAPLTPLNAAAGKPAVTAKAPDAVKLDPAAAIQAWLDESIASAPPSDKMHISTHLKSCLPALLEKLK